VQAFLPHRLLLSAFIKKPACKKMKNAPTENSQFCENLSCKISQILQPGFSQSPLFILKNLAPPLFNSPNPFFGIVICVPLL